MSKFILGPNGRLLLVGGRALSVIPAQPPANTLSVALTPFYTINSTARFNVPTNAASDDTAADVPVVFTYTGEAPRGGHVQARAVDAAGEPIPGADWTTLQGVTVNDTDKTGLGYLPGVRAGIGYKREIRIEASGGTLTHADAAAFNIGLMLLPWGQSNGRGTMDGGFSRDTAAPGTGVTELQYFNTNGTGAFFGQAGFVQGGINSYSIGNYNVVQGGGLSLLRILGARLQSKLGRKVGVALNPWCLNATAIGNFVNTSGFSPMLHNAGTASPDIGMSSPAQYITGDYRVVSFHQGETGATTRATRLADLKRFCQAHIDHVAKYGRTPDKLTFLFAVMGVYGKPDAITVAHAEVLRAAVFDLVEYAKTVGWDVRIGWSCIDLDPMTVNDTLHFGAADQRISLRRLTQSMLNVLDPVAVPHGARGPRLTGAYTRSGDDITLTVEHEGVAALAAKNPANPITGFYANTAADFGGTELTVSNVTILSSTQIRVTVTGAPPTFYIKHCGHKFGTYLSTHPDVSNLIYDDFVYPTGADAGDQYTGLPLLPTPDAIEVT